MNESDASLVKRAAEFVREMIRLFLLISQLELLEDVNNLACINM